MENFKMIAKTLAGLEEVLAKEIEVLGGTNIVVGTRMVSYEGNKELLYKSNLWLRTALRVLMPVENFQAGDPDELYNIVKSIDWSKYVAEGQTIAIDNTIFSENFRNSRYAIYRTKDAICDWFVEKGMKRPKIAVASADVQLNLHIADTAEALANEGRSQVTLSLDSSGEPLYKRGYKEQQTDAPISEVLAAGILMKAGWDGQRDLFDPMCGSGTFLIEAALMATNTPAGIYRKSFGFQRWTEGEYGFDEELWQNLFRKLAPDAIPVMALDAPGIWTLASVSEDGREMMVMVNNLSGDMRENLSFSLADEWVGATVSRLCVDGRGEKGGKVAALWSPKCVFGQMQPEFFVFTK